MTTTEVTAVREGMRGLTGKNVLVTGGTSGIGQAIAVRFAEHGANVAINYLKHPEEAAETEEQVRACVTRVRQEGVRDVLVGADVSSEDEVARMVADAVDQLGGIDVLVNNAFHGGDAKSVLEADLQAWRDVIDINLFGALHMTRAIAPHMEARGGGYIVMINTMSTERIQAKFGSYAASKSALKGVTKTLARELGPMGIRVNAIHPGYIWGDSVEWYFNYQAEKRGVTFQEVYDEVASETCLGYLPSSEEIAGSVVFFASDLAKAVTGQSIGVNAGHWFQG
jgi:NAD(P)-dependent dehydrogenase (short-subunit alcohol dehydrogenase family)